MQQYACIFLLPNHSLHVSGIQRTHHQENIKTAASGTGHSIWALTFLQHGLIRPHWRKVVAQILWPVPEAAVTVLCTPYDGCDGHPKHVE